MKRESGISVLMPTYNQAPFIRRAILSLMEQTYKHWELIIINDGSTDETKFYLEEFLPHPQIIYIENSKNQGLGYSLNLGLDRAKFEYIAYLPSDDYFLKNHLLSMQTKMDEFNGNILVFSGVCFENPDSMGGSFLKKNESSCIRKGYCLQLVQTMHKKTNDKWLERREWVT